MLGGLKSSLAFAGVTLFGAAILAANLGDLSSGRSNSEGGYGDATYVATAQPDESTVADETYDSSDEETQGASFDEGSSADFANDSDLIDDTSGFDPNPNAIAPEDSDTDASVGSASEGEGDSAMSNDLDEGFSPMTISDM
jgi:hypothetical protein